MIIATLFSIATREQTIYDKVALCEKKNLRFNHQKTLFIREQETLNCNAIFLLAIDRFGTENIFVEHFLQKLFMFYKLF